VVTDFVDAAIDLGMVNGELEDGTTLNTLANAISDPMIQIDPSFVFKDDFQLLFSKNLFAPTSAVLELPTWLMMALGFAGLGFAGCRESRRPTTHFGGARLWVGPKRWLHRQLRGRGAPSRSPTRPSRSGAEGARQ
jgi:hypothetical protein